MAGKGKEKSGTKTTRAQEPAEEEPAMHKPIKITMRRPEPEPADFVQKIRLGTTTDEEAEEEESTEPLERHAPKQSREQQEKETTPITEGEGEQEESRAAQKEAAPDQMLPDDGQEQVLPDFASEQVFPDLGRGQVPKPETSAR